MRALLLIAGAALALGGCGKNNQSDATQNGDENLTAASIVSNDVTAIDAVTGDAANMAADVDMNFGNLNQIGGNDTQPATSPAPRAAEKSSSNQVSNTVANSSAPATATANSQ